MSLKSRGKPFNCTCQRTALCQIARCQIHRNPRRKIVSVITYVLANDVFGQLLYILVIWPARPAGELVDRSKYSFIRPAAKRLEPLSTDHYLREVFQAVSYLRHAHQATVQTKNVELPSSQCVIFYFLYELGQGNHIEAVRRLLAQKISKHAVAVTRKDEQVMIGRRFLAVHTI